MTRLLIQVNGIPVHLQPDSLNWIPRPIVAKDGNGAPIYGPYWGVTMGFPRVTDVKYEFWMNLMDGEEHTFKLPHPETGVMTDFTAIVDSVEHRFDVRDGCTPAVRGADITLSRITV